MSPVSKYEFQTQRGRPGSRSRRRRSRVLHSLAYPIGGGTPPKPPPEEEDEARALADAIDAVASDALRGDGFIGSRELTAQLLQAADASRAPCRSPFAELGDGEGLPQQ